MLHRRKTAKKVICITGVFLLGVAVWLVARPAYHLAKVARADVDDITPSANGVADDASRLNATVVTEQWSIPADKVLAEEQLRALLLKARTLGLKVSIAGARHSMGGHTISPNGVVIDMLPHNHMELRPNDILHVQSGARWSKVIEFLNAHGRSVEIMQSNDDFSVGGSLSVNCHGWQFNRPPIASSVESFRLMKSNGEIVVCSRTENSELFSLALGGYGLFGIILDADLRTLPNEVYRVERLEISTSNYATAIKDAGQQTDVAMAYGRLRVTSEKFLGEAVLNVLHRTTATNGVISKLGSEGDSRLKRTIFRGSVGSDYGKQLRWDAEKNLSSLLTGDVFERNALLYVPVSLFQNRRTNSTDILMECFVPPTEFESFLADLRSILPKHKVDLLNVTVRSVNADRDSMLNYARQDVLALVLLFDQERTSDGEMRMASAAKEIIETSIQHHGTYYLPYRLHATAEQFRTAYPMQERFFALKKKYDPEELFVNEFYRKYGSRLQETSQLDN